MALINASNWPPTQSITTSSKSTLLQELIYEEVIEKRRKQIRNMRKGLRIFKLVSLMRKYPRQLRPLLVYSDSSLNVDTMISLFQFGCYKDKSKQIIISWQDYRTGQVKQKASYSNLCTMINQHSPSTEHSMIGVSAV